MRWLDEHAEGWSQTWEGDASVLRTTVSLGGQTAEIVDAVDPDEPVLVRRVVSEPAVLVVSVQPSLEGTERPTGAFVDPATRIVVLHRRRAAIALAVDRPGAEVEVRSAGGVGDDVAHVAPIEARVEVGYEGVTHLVVALGAGPFEALDRARRHLALAASAAARRGAADERLLSRTAVGSGSTDLDRALQRSVLVLAQLADRTTGGVVAAPEMDEGFMESGGYGFVWPRDLAYVVLGLLAAGCDDLAVAALRWLARTQAPEGLWLHRYWTTGEPAPSWGLHQIDETGVVLVAAEAAFRELGDEALDAGLWPVVRRAADLLVSFVDPATGLPRASIDLWEQHDAQHAYSAAAVVGGLRAAALTAARHEPALGDVYARASSEIAAALDRHLWDDSLGRYRRAVSLGRQTERAGRSAPRSIALSRTRTGVSGAWTRPTRASTARCSASRGRSHRSAARPSGCGRPSMPSNGASRRPRMDCGGTRGTRTAADTNGRSRVSGSASRAGRSATARPPRAPSPRWSDGGRRSTSCPSRYARTAARPGSCRSAGATRCCSSLPGPSWS